jgi:hypothetical protein
VLQKSLFSFVKSAQHDIVEDVVRERKNATPTNETAKKTQRDFGTKALRRDGVQKSTPGGGRALSLMQRVRDAAKCDA